MGKKPFLIFVFFLFFIVALYFLTDFLPIANFFVSDIPEIKDFINDKLVSSDVVSTRSHKISDFLSNYKNKAISDVVFSKDGDHVAYVLEDSNYPGSLRSTGSFVIKDSEILAEYIYDEKTGIYGYVSNYRLDWALKFSNGGRYLMHWANYCKGIDTKKKCNEFIVINKNKIGPFNSIGPTIFSQDNENMAFVATKLGKQCVFLNGENYGCYTFVNNLTFSPDGKILGYTTKSLIGGEKIYLISNGKKQKSDLKYKNVFDIVLNSQKDKIAYAFRETETGGKQCVIFDNKEKCYVDIGATESYGQFLTFSPDGELVYIVTESLSGQDKISTGRTFRMFINGNEYGLPFESVSHLRFNPAKKEILFGARKNYSNNWLMGQLNYVDGLITEGPTYKHLNYQEVSFSPDGQHFVYVGTQCDCDDNWLLIVDNVERKDEKYRLVSNLNFNFDGSKLSFGTLSGQEWWWIVKSTEE